MAAGLILLFSWLCCWAVFFRAPAHPTAAHPDRTFYMSTCAVALALLLWVLSGWSAQMPFSCVVFCIGLAVTIVGQVLMCSARRALNLSNYDLLFSLADRSTVAGPYRRLHHPMYIGLLLALAGTSTALMDVLGLFVLLCVVLPVLVLRAYIETN